MRCVPSWRARKPRVATTRPGARRRPRQCRRPRRRDWGTLALSVARAAAPDARPRASGAPARRASGDLVDLGAALRLPVLGLRRSRATANPRCSPSATASTTERGWPRRSRMARERIKRRRAPVPGGLFDHHRDGGLASPLPPPPPWHTPVTSLTASTPPPLLRELAPRPVVALRDRARHSTPPPTPPPSGRTDLNRGPADPNGERYRLRHAPKSSGIPQASLIPGPGRDATPALQARRRRFTPLRANPIPVPRSWRPRAPAVAGWPM